MGIYYDVRSWCFLIGFKGGSVVFCILDWLNLSCVFFMLIVFSMRSGFVRFLLVEGVSVVGRSVEGFYWVFN